MFKVSVINRGITEMFNSLTVVVLQASYLAVAMKVNYINRSLGLFVISVR
jgi:hypothetical protein